MPTHKTALKWPSVFIKPAYRNGFEHGLEPRATVVVYAIGNQNALADKSDAGISIVHLGAISDVADVLPGFVLVATDAHERGTDGR